MAYVKNIWVDQDVERPKTYEVTNNQDGSITLTDSFGLVTELGTPVNEVNMNHIEDGIDGCAIRKHNLTETFNLGEWVLGGTGDDEGIYKSLIANNVGNAITDDTKWEKVELGGGSGYEVGDIIIRSTPTNDAGKHLLDGALIQYGSYQAFVDYIADLVTDYPDLSCTESDWQTAVTTYGVCEKFVYDSVNNTVRLPKYGNQIVTKSSRITSTSTAPVIGNGISLGFTDGTDGYGLSATANHIPQLFTNIYGANVNTASSGNAVTTKSLGITTDATKSGLVTNLSGITNYPLNCYYYIVIATTTKTDIEVDIDEIATDLNGKADIDLTNVNNAGTSRSSGWTMASETYTTLTLGASGTLYTAPANGYFALGVDATADTSWAALSLYNNAETIGIMAKKYRTSKSGDAIRIYLPVAKNAKVIVSYSSITSNYFRFVYAKGSESEA